MAKKTVVNEVASALGAAAARVETSLKPKRSTVAKHSKAKVTMVEEPLQDTVVESAEPAELDRNEIALVAYLRWESRGFQGGSPEEDWLIAEQEVRAKSTATA